MRTFLARCCGSGGGDAMAAALGYVDPSVLEPRKSSSGGALLLLVIVAVAGYMAWRLGWLDPLLAVVANKPLPSSSAPAAAAKLGGPVEAAAKAVNGSVVFEGGSGGNASCCGCGLIDPKHYPSTQKMGSDPCRARVDPCALVTDRSIDGSPKCHTIGSLCSEKVVPSGPAGSNGSPLCMLQEHCGGGCGGIGDSDYDYMASVEVPEGISLDAKHDAKCGGGGSAYSKACTDPAGCKWTRTTYQDSEGMQFGVAPGYQITCKGRVIRGPSQG